jgi:hypothetical protein
MDWLQHLNKPISGVLIAAVTILLMATNEQAAARGFRGGGGGGFHGGDFRGGRFGDMLGPRRSAASRLTATASST